jgi:hypothetical protein
MYKEVANKKHLQFLQVMGFQYERHESENYLVKQLA